MAYQYDAMGNFIGEYESEEERAAREKAEREAAQAQVQKQEVITRADGTQTVKTTQEVGAPVAPDQVFNRMIQAESGGQQFNKSGGILTSPAGAQGMAQIMPATARQPGYGVTPATPEEIATPEGNRAFGERYFQGLLKHFGGDIAKATAAYNGGPGRVERNVQANAGQMNTAQLPRETQGYLQKVLGQVANAVIPSAQAGTLPQPQAGAGRGGAGMPMAQPGPGVAVATGNGILGTMSVPEPTAASAVSQTAPAPAPGGVDYSLGTGTPGPGGLRIPSFASGITAPAAPDSAAQIERYQANQDNPLELLQLRADETAAPWMRERAGKRAAELLRQEDQRAAAETRLQDLTARVAAGDPKASREMASELKSEGSWVKMLLLGFISPQLAGEEAMKLGFGNKDRTVYDADGQAGMITFRADGKPLSGVKADGTAMSQRELIVYAGGGKRDVDIVGGTYVNDQTGEVGRVVSDKRTGQSFVQTETGRKPLTGFRPQGQGGTLDSQRAQAVMRQNVDLAGDWAKLQMRIQGAAPEAANKFMGEFNAKHGTNFGLQSITGAAPQIDLTTGRMTSGAPGAAAATPAAVAPAPAVTAGVPGTVAGPVAPGAAPVGQTPAKVAEAAEAAKTGAVTEAKETAEDIAKVKAGQGKAERQADYLITKMNELVKHPGFETSVGAQGATYLFGAIDKPLPPQLGGGPARDWQNRAREVIGGGFVQAIEALKGLGALSDAEGKSAAAAIQRLGYMDPKTNLPVVTATEAEFRAAVKDFQEVIQRNVDGNRVKLGQKPKYGTPPESTQSAPAAPAAPAASDSPADRARAELERRKKSQGR